MTDENMEFENDNIIVLTDEDGVDVEFEFCASIQYEGEEYVVLLPMDDDEGEVVILQVVANENAQEDDEEVTYIGVDDDDVLAKVFELFREQAGDEFDFES